MIYYGKTMTKTIIVMRSAPSDLKDGLVFIVNQLNYVYSYIHNKYILIFLKT